MPNNFPDILQELVTCNGEKCIIRGIIDYQPNKTNMEEEVKTEEVVETVEATPEEEVS